MRDLISIYTFNYKRMLKTWMIWIFTGIIFAVIAVGLHIYTSTNEQFNIYFNNDASIEITSSSLEEILSKISSNNYKVTDGYENISDFDESCMGITLSNEEGKISIRYDYKTSEDIKVDVEECVTALIKDTNTMIILSENNIEADLNNVIVNRNISNDNEASIVSYIILFIIYCFTLLCGATITNSVATERISKVSDLIVYRVSQVKLIYGKILALFTIVLQLIVAVALEIVILSKTKFIDLDVIFDIFKNFELTSRELWIVAIISLLGIIIYTLLYAIVGIFVNDQQEMQFAQLPVTVILVVAFVIAYMTIPNPGSVLSKICIYIPFTAPFLMGNAILNNTVSMFTIVISGISIIGFIFLCNYLIIRIFIPKKMIK